MKKFSNKIERLAAVAILSGLILPAVAMAKGKSSHHGGGHSNQVRRSPSSHNGNQYRGKSNYRPKSTSGNQFHRTTTFRGTTKKASPRSSQQPRRVANTPTYKGRSNSPSMMSRFGQSQNQSGKPNFRHANTKGGQFKGQKSSNNHKWNGNHKGHTGHANHKWNGNHKGHKGHANHKWNGNHKGHGNHKWNWGHNGHGYWPTYWGGNHWSNRYCRPCPTYYPTQTVVVSQPAEAALPVEPAPLDAQPAAANVDLVLEDLQFAEPATALVGPAYRVKFRNQGMEAAGKFRVGLLAAVDGKASEDSPQAVFEVAGLAAGQAGEVTIRIPQAAMKLVGTSGQPTAFTHLFVAIDIDGVVSESDTSNNGAIVERKQLELAGL